jgi:hypothetical protein
MEFVTQAFIVVVSLLLSFGTVLVIFVTLTRTRRRRYELQAEVQSKLIDRFGTAQELVDFLHSRAGREFVSGVQTGATGVARDKIASGFKRAIVLLALGGAFMVLWGITGTEGLAFPGVILLALGLAFLGAAFVSLKLTSHDEPALPPPPARTDLPADV